MSKLIPQLNKILLLAFSYVLFFSGIIRHDVKKSKYHKLALQSNFDCVGQIYKNNIGIGSCVLINRNFILSAAHVFIESDTKTDTMTINGNKVIVYVPTTERIIKASNLTIQIKDIKRKIKRIVIHPNYLNNLTKGSCDIALIELENSIENIAFPELNTTFKEINSMVIGVGYGVFGYANRPSRMKSYGLKIAGENMVDSIFGNVFDGQQTILGCDFDHPTEICCNKMGESKPTPLEYICSGGDSGGGLFSLNNEKTILIGICSGSGTDIEQLIKTGGYYGQTMEWTRVAAFVNWINSNFN